MPKRMLTPEEARELRKAHREFPGGLYEEIDGSGGATCRACGKEILRGERALKYADWEPLDPHPHTTGQIHLKPCDASQL